MASQSTYVFLFLAVLCNILMTSHFPFNFSQNKATPPPFDAEFQWQWWHRQHTSHICYAHALPAATKRWSLVGSNCSRLRQQSKWHTGTFRSIKPTASPCSCPSTWYLHSPAHMEAGMARLRMQQKEYCQQAGEQALCSSGLTPQC